MSSKSTAAERQRRFRASQKELGRDPVQLYLTPDERFYLERTLQTIREEGATPAMARRANGTLCVIDV